MNPDSLPLRDIHLPEPIPWWPPAPGWWFVAALAVAAIMAGIWMWHVRQQSRALDVKNIALQRLRGIRADYAKHGDAHTLAGELSVLLRQVSITTRPPPTVASLTGEQWLRFLDQVSGGKEFQDGPGRVLLNAPYQKKVDIDASHLLNLSETWIRALPARPAEEDRA